MKKDIVSSRTARRTFLKNALLGLSLLPFLKDASRLAWAAPKKEPLPAGMQEVPANDPVASAIGYKPDVALVDMKKYPQRKKPDAKNQFCEGCALYTKVNAGWGKCQMLPNGAVAAKGWCGSWSKKT